MDDLLDLLAEVIEAGDVDGLGLDEALSLPDAGLEGALDGFAQAGDALDPLLDGDSWSLLEAGAGELAESSFEDALGSLEIDHSLEGIDFDGVVVDGSEAGTELLDGVDFDGVVVDGDEVLRTDALDGVDFESAAVDGGEVLGSQLADAIPLHSGEYALGAELVHGDPLSALTSFKEQCFNDSCAVACQSQILQQWTGEGFDEQILAQQAKAMGWYVPGSGTPLMHTGSLLELHGFDTDNVAGATIDGLKEWLEQGKAIIAGVDGEEIWNVGSPQCTLSELMGYPDAGHAVRVTGVVEDLSSGVTSVVLNDPGHAAGAGVKIPIQDFLDAWEDTGNFACVVSRS